MIDSWNHEVGYVIVDDTTETVEETLDDTVEEVPADTIDLDNYVMPEQIATSGSLIERFLSTAFHCQYEDVTDEQKTAITDFYVTYKGGSSNEYRITYSVRDSRDYTFTLSNVTGDSAYSKLPELTGLRQLSIEDENVKNISFLDGMDSVEELTLDVDPFAYDIFSGQLDEVEKLELTSLDGADTLDLLYGFPNVTNLRLGFESSKYYTGDLSPILALEHVNHLSLMGFQNVYFDITPVFTRDYEFINLCKCYFAFDPDKLVENDTLTSLYLDDVYMLTNVTTEVSGTQTTVNYSKGRVGEYDGFFLNFPNLTTLSVLSCELKDVSDIGQLTKLEHLDLRDNYITDSSPLDNLPAIQDISLSGNAL